MTAPQHRPSGDNGPPPETADVGGEKEQTTTTSQDPTPSSDISNPDTSKPGVPSTHAPLWRRLYRTLSWVPPRARFDPNSPPKFSMRLNVLFAFAGAFTVANLYYNHPILNILARDFDVPYETVAQIPTLAQAGYAIGLFFLCPLGDLFKRRPFVLSLVFFTATMRWVFLHGGVWWGVRCADGGFPVLASASPTPSPPSAPSSSLSG